MNEMSYLDQAAMREEEMKEIAFSEINRA